TLTYGLAAGSVGATANGDGTLSYEVKSGNSVSVDATSGELTINSVGDSIITIKAPSTLYYKEATKDITVSVEKGSQTIFSPNELTLKAGNGPSAIGATTDGDGTLSYKVTSGDAVTVDANGNITPVAVGNATVTVTAAATNNYKEVTKDISVTVSEKNPQVIEANDISLKVDEKGTLNATLSKGDGTLSFDVFGDSINFNDSTVEIEAIKEGTSTIVITASETEDFAETVKTVTITVTKKDEPANPENLEPDPNEPSDPGDEDLSDPEIPDKDWLDDLRLALRIADELGGERTVEYSGDFALSYDIMKYLEEHPLITLIYHVTYEDVEYTITIPAGKAIADPEIPWYGPLWLLANYGGKTPNATR
ncbi:Ig-like domain (group 2), partial [Lachnospiraceae bacterium G41]